MGIPKFPQVPPLSDKQIQALTTMTFYQEIKPEPCDAIFVFGGSHLGNWQQPLQAYNNGLSKKIIVTGGSSSWGMKHRGWNEAAGTEAEHIVSKLLENGVPKDIIVYETKSKSSLENVTEAKAIVDFTTIKSLLVICKSYGTGRQIRTLQKQLQEEMVYIPYPFDTNFDDEPLLTRSTWHETEKNRALVFGEYIRIIHYGNQGHISSINQPIDGLEDAHLPYIK